MNPRKLLYSEGLTRLGKKLSVRSGELYLGTETKDLELSISVSWDGNASPHELVLRLQWRSTNGNPVHMLRGDLTEAYAGEHCPLAP